MTDQMLIELAVKTNSELEFPYAELSGNISRGPTVLVRYCHAGKLQPQGLRLDLQKHAFLDQFDEREAERALREAIPRIIERITSQLPGMLEETAYQCLCPEEAPKLGAFDIAGECQPLLPLIRDFVDHVPLHDGSLVLVCGWVVGLNVYTTIGAIRARTAIRSVAAACSDPGEILTRVNQILIADHTRDAMVPTQLAVLRPDRRTIQFANAGGYGFLLDRCGNLKSGVEMEAPLGVCEDYQFPAGPPIEVEAGDIYASCNDGILEAESTQSEFFGQDKLVRFLDHNRSLGARETIEKLFASISQEIPGGRPGEGFAITVAKVTPGSCEAK